MRCEKIILLALVAVLVSSAAVNAQSTGFGSRIRNLSWFKKDASSATPSTTPTAPSRSQTTFAPSPLAPQPSVTMPAPTSPAGNTPRVARNEKPAFGSRIWSAASSAGDVLAIKPRETAAPDPVRLDNTTEGHEAAIFVSAARVYEMQGKLPQAREHYEKALANNPQHLDALVGLARLKHREGNLVGATEMYQQALRAHPDNAMVQNDLGLCYARRDMLPQAQQSLEKAVKADPESKLYRNNLALVLVEAGRDDEALRQLMSVHSEAVSHYNMAYLLKEKGLNDEAADHLRTALQLEPRLEPARAMLARLNPAPINNAINSANTAISNAAPYVNGGGQLGLPRINNAAPADQRRTPAPVVNYRQPTQPYPVSHRQDTPANPPANVGKAETRYDGGNAAAYRGTTGTQSNMNRLPPNWNDRTPANPPSNGAAPTPGAYPEYIRGENPAQPESGSRWSNP